MSKRLFLRGKRGKEEAATGLPLVQVKLVGRNEI